MYLSTHVSLSKQKILSETLLVPCKIVLMIVVHYMCNIIVQVHFKRSVKRVAHTVCKGDIQAYNAFKAIGYHTLKATLVDDIKTLFSVLCGDLSIQEAVKLIPTSEVLHTYATRHNPSSWQGSARWSEWWTRPRHLSMFSYCTIVLESVYLPYLPMVSKCL